jgi:hypothetical protein
MTWTTEAIINFSQHIDMIPFGQSILGLFLCMFISILPMLIYITINGDKEDMGYFGIVGITLCSLMRKVGNLNKNSKKKH